jgi:hypothetical protein
MWGQEKEGKEEGEKIKAWQGKERRILGKGKEGKEESEKIRIWDRKRRKKKAERVWKYAKIRKYEGEVKGYKRRGREGAVDDERKWWRV